MNVESLKSELQQVLDNDVVLRKEFNALKRSLSDYRNQLIMRDEDCKRLQVTIDVLNTKLVVMERDNTTYKAELSSFKELRGTIKDQLQAKQEEIDVRLLEIQGLRDDLNSLAANYESQIEALRTAADVELERVTNEFAAQLNELRSGAHYRESGIREEYENRLAELNNRWADKEQSLLLNHEEEIARAIAGSSTEVEALRSKLSEVEEKYRTDVTGLRSALEEQRSTLTTSFTSQVEKLQAEFSVKEAALNANFETQLETLGTSQNTSLTETIASYETKTAALVADYEEKLSHTLIHSNSQNSKLNEELAKAQSEQEFSAEKIKGLETALEETQTELRLESEKHSNTISEFDSYRQQALLSGSDQVNELNQQIATLNTVHSDYVNELNTQIEGLNTELKNLGQLFESTTNTLAETENALEAKGLELAEANASIEELKNQLGTVDLGAEEKERELQAYKVELEATAKQELGEKNLEYDKLLAENTNLIEEIDSAQDKIEAQEQEISILKGELEEVKLQGAGKSEYFKETLANRNFEITNLEANNAALAQEIVQLRSEVADLQAGISDFNTAEQEASVWQEKFNLASTQNVDLGAEILELKTVIAELNEKIVGLNTQVNAYEAQLNDTKPPIVDAEQEAFIDRLFKQLDDLNDQRLTLLDEKEQMAAQLLKMNDVVGSLSQQVDSEKIDVSGLNNHRKNVILATNSEGTTGKSPMKEHINDLVREIDKCIALLSA